jgi:cytochrome c oxidase subunit 2
VARQAGAATREPQDALLREGRDRFVGLGCGACHAVRGLSDARLGPDLTGVGARQTIGAGTLPAGNIAGWIASAQHLKPGNAMPSYDQLEGPAAACARRLSHARRE